MPEKMKITMSEAEIGLLRRFMTSSCSYFEFGMGGSTCLAAELVTNDIHAIDSDPMWVANVRENIGETQKRISLQHIDVGPTGAWGTPIPNSGCEHLYDAYSASIAGVGTKFDLVLVDGRFRVACVLQTLQSQRADTVVAIHDYHSRPKYHLVEDFARPICACHELYFFVRRPDFDERALESALAAYRRISD
jgi:hypothetical protein